MAKKAKSEFHTDATFKLKKTNAILSNWNPRTEHKGDDLDLASDLTFTVSVPASVLNDLTSGDIDWLSLLWDAEENCRDIGVTSLAFDVKFINHKFILIGSRKELAFTEATIRKIVATPKAGKRVELKFQAQIHPEDDQLKEIAIALKGDKISVKIEVLKSSGAVREGGDDQPELPLGEPEGEEEGAAVH